jgi:hypothetical protein
MFARVAERQQRTGDDVCVEVYPLIPIRSRSPAQRRYSSAPLRLTEDVRDTPDANRSF